MKKRQSGLGSKPLIEHSLRESRRPTWKRPLKFSKHQSRMITITFESGVDWVFDLLGLTADRLYARVHLSLAFAVERSCLVRKPF